MDVSSLHGSSSNSTVSSAAARPPGRLLRQEAAEQAQHGRDTFNMALRINYLEEQLLLLKGGEDCTKTDVLVELAELRDAVSAREHELRQRTLDWTRVVDDLRAQLDEAKGARDRASTPLQEPTKDVGAAAAVASSTAVKQYQRICLKLRDKLNAMTEKKEKSRADARSLQQQVDQLSAVLCAQENARRDLERDYKTALDSMYELKTQARQRDTLRSELEERLKLCAPVSGGKVWTRRCDQQRVTHEREMTLLNGDLAHLKAEKANVEEALRQDVEKDLVDLKESNRVLLEDLQECYRHYTETCRENRSLMKAARVYKSAIAVRDADVQKYTERLRVRTSMNVVRQTMIEQLQETRHLLSATSRRLKTTPIWSEDGERIHDHILQIESVSKQWGGTFAKFQDLQQRMADRLSRRYNKSKRHPRWIVDAKQECLSLQVEASILSRTVCSLVRIFVCPQQLIAANDGARTLHSTSNGCVPACHSQKPTQGERLVSLDTQLEKEETRILRQTY
ncbi:unnamed protein product [Hyaloperonospora brassicae]|uniref:Centrosomin N-terminal motif 1 domain-containing protein n=1 Tax=Hyaloperonospora brassicae TaxID=162125 RepID=A0AAV0SXD2_HYABA|nr:unnamed protein product [Hyaloperonospora brassicae]